MARRQDTEETELHESEKSRVAKVDGAKFNATCIHCGSTADIQMWPHRNGHGDMVGIVFACSKCEDVVRGVWMEIHGIRGHDGREEG